MADEQTARQRDNATWAGFLVMAFVIVGLTGVFATYAGPLPLERALARDAVLDQAQATLSAPDPHAALERLRPALGDSAGKVLDGPDDPTHLSDRIAAERAAMRSRLTAEAQGVARELRLLILVMTAAGAIFGAALLGVARNRR
jgi:hypothetical protein